MDERRTFASGSAPSDVLSAFCSYAARKGWTVDATAGRPNGATAVEPATWATWNKRIEVHAAARSAGGSTVEVVVSTNQPITCGALRRTADALTAALTDASEPDR